MIHYWQCSRCTHEWRTSCFGHLGENEEERRRHRRQSASGLCWDCFKLLENEKIAGLELFNLFFYLREKSDYFDEYSESHNLGRVQKNDMWFSIVYSGMCHDYESDVYGPDGNIVKKGNFESGFTAEQNQLHKIVYEVEEVYDDAIKKQRTAKRIELDDYQKDAGFVLFGLQPRPDGFVGDPSGEPRFEALFGIDFSGAGIKFVPPTIVEES